jgi:DUF438 domain-containing protein
MNRLRLLSALCLILLPAVGTAEPLEIPYDYKTLVNTVSFVRSLARKCDIELEMFGTASHPPKVHCQEFLSQMDGPGQTWKANQQAWTRLEHAIEHSPDVSLRLQWRRLNQQMIEDLEQMDKTLQHLTFLVHVKRAAEKPVKKTKSR